MATKAAHRRLAKEYQAIVQNAPPYITAKPSEANMLEWHYLIDGPVDTPYEGGQFHGTLTFTSEYPFKPPAIRMITPNGRFQTNTRLCLSMSDYHPDTWNPAWSVSTILTGLLSFMTGDEPTTGSIVTSAETKKRCASESLAWNAKQNPRFAKQFPDLVEENLKRVAEREQRQKEAAIAKAKAEEEAKLKTAGIDLDKMDAEDRIRYLAAAKSNKLNYDASSQSHFVYYVLAIAVVLGFFKFVN